MLRMGREADAERDALLAISHRPGWARGYQRLGQALAQGRRWKEAARALRRGEAALRQRSGAAMELTRLLDQVAVDAALEGCEDGFDGRVLEVRPAGEGEEWRGLPAPADPSLDAPPPALAAALLPGPGGDAGLGASGSAALAAAWQRTSFRGLHEAVEAARDGDRILLLPGTHATGHAGRPVVVTKRLLIKSAGGDGAAVVDHRGNTAALKLARACVVAGLRLDATGFAEAVLVSGDALVRALLLRCDVSSSGGVALVAVGGSRAVLGRCAARGARGGARVGQRCGVELVGCTLEDCGGPAVAASGGASVALSSCVLARGKHDGVVASGSARVAMVGTEVTGFRGPGVDVSGRASVALSRCQVRGNRGGVFAWDEGRWDAADCYIDGGDSHAVLVDADARPDPTGTTLHGVVHATDLGWEGIRTGGNTVVQAEPTELPPDVEPFVYRPDPYQPAFG